MNDGFRKWWMNGGSEKWSKALDAEGGTLKALEMVFNAGMSHSSGFEKGDCGHFCEACARRDDEIKRLKEYEYMYKDLCD